MVNFVRGLIFDFTHLAQNIAAWNQSWHSVIHPIENFILQNYVILDFFALSWTILLGIRLV